VQTQPSKTPRPRESANGFTDLGPRAREVEAVLDRLAQKPASTLSILVEVHRLIGPFSPGVIQLLAERLSIDTDELAALAEAHRLVAGRRQPCRLGICANSPCAARGGNEVERVFAEKMMRFEPLRCQGACDLGPVVCFDRSAPLAISTARARALIRAEPSEWEELLAVEKPVHAFRTEPRVAFESLFSKGSHQLATARRLGIWKAAEKALGMTSEALLAEIEASGLIGGEQNGEPVIDKLKAIARAKGPRVLVIDALDLEPGSTRQRVLLERDPQRVLAGCAIAAHAAGAEEAFLCIRAEYELVRERCLAAIDESRRAGLIGASIFGSGTSLDVHQRSFSSLAFCLNPRRLVEALEGRAPRPLDALPPLHKKGLFGRPTAVLDAETLACLPAIIDRGAAWYRGLGQRTESASCGEGALKIVTLGGDVKRPGNYEISRGQTLRYLFEELGGGLAQGKNLLALQIGGASGPYLPREALDATFEATSLSHFGAHLGCGAVIALSEKSCLFDLARREARFFIREACRACEGCAQELEELGQGIDRLGNGLFEPAQLLEIDRRLQERACPLARNAARPFRSVLEAFPEALQAHRNRACACFPRQKRE
jgi:NADH:ubiquinone oxidoreductase subunit F (NADH-binding)/NADH:ubiquinone oxidoreductase subunit E